MKTPDPTTLDADYYPQIKLRGRWYMIVPEMEGVDNPHVGCAFHRPEMGDEDFSHCKLMAEAHKRRGDGYGSPEFKRHDCGDRGTIFVAPSKFPEYRAHLVAEQLEGKT